MSSSTKVATVGIAAVVVLVGCTHADGSGDPWNSNGSDDGADLCSVSAYEDDMVLETQARAEADAEVRKAAMAGDVAVLCGVDFVQIYDPSTAQIGDAVSIDGACSAIAVVDDATWVVGTDGGTLERFTHDGLAPTRTASVDAGAPIGGVAVDSSTLWAAASTSGVLRFDTTSLAPTGASDVEDARDVTLTDVGPLVAAGEAGIVLLDASGAHLDTKPTQTAASGVRARGSRAVVLRGAQGWDLVDVGPSGVTIIASVPTRGVVLDAAWTGDEVLTVEGHAVVRHDVSGNSPERVSVERRPATTDMAASWLRAIATNDGDALVVADDAGAMPLQLRTPAAAPDVVVDVPSVAMWADPGSSTEAIYLVSNEGTAPLHLRGVATASPFSASVDAEGLEASSQCPGQHVLEPGATAVLELGFTPDDPAAVEDTLVIETDDPDEPAIEIALDGNRPAPAIGEPAPDFSLLSLDGHRVRLSDHRERVVFLKLFNFGCSTCAMEFPEIEAQLLPDYDPADLAVIGINISHRTAYADTLRTDANLTLPIALDLQSEVFRHLRAPHKVFPLHVVIDRTGTIAHLDTNPGLTSIRAALEQLGTGSYP